MHSDAEETEMGSILRQCHNLASLEALLNCSRMNREFVSKLLHSQNASTRKN